MQELSLEMARSYKLGQKEDNNGVLLVVATNEKKVRIEVGYGLEGVDHK
ncbi:TPM domain-containing protein [Campylobacter concisus]|nr:TPM domain-containing protein [Campylobacter concisus]